MSADVEAFLARYGAELGVGEVRTAIARAPGRLDLMGGIADYSGSLVLQLPIADATVAAAQRTKDQRVVVESYAEGRAAWREEIACEELRALAEAGYAEAQRALTSAPEGAWASYVLGTLLVLVRERGATLDAGLRVRVESRVPEGKGVSSSAALEVASCVALAALLELDIHGAELARLCQLAENRVVGAPCGIMDQMASALGRGDQLLALRCQPAEVLGFRALPRNLRVWGIDSGVRHAVSGASYGDVRVGAFMGYRILAELEGLAVTQLAEGRVQVEDRAWKGYLANVDAERFAREFAERVPEEMLGADFLARYGGITDTVTRVRADVRYAVRQAARHPIEENRRVERFAAILDAGLDGGVDVDAARELGGLMFASHASYSACGLGSEATDRIVDAVRDAGPERGLYGAKITGGGSGGTVAVLGRADAAESLRQLAEAYARERGIEARVFEGSSDGALAHGARVLSGRS